MREVWKARDTRLDRTVAGNFSQAAFTGRSGREARAIGKLNHPKIATLRDPSENAPRRECNGDTRKPLTIAIQLAAGPAVGIVNRTPCWR